MGWPTRGIAWLCALLIPAAALAQTFPQTFPTRPLRLIVPFPAGGPADIFGRFLA